MIALRLIKDKLIHIGGPLKIPLNKDLLKSCKNARSSYCAFLEAQKLKEKTKKKQKEQDEALKEKEKKKASKHEVVKQLERELDYLNTYISALKAVEEGNMEMGEEMQKKDKDVDIKGRKLSQAKVAMGMKRKGELESKADQLKKKIAKAEKEF